MTEESLSTINEPWKEPANIHKILEWPKLLPRTNLFTPTFLENISPLMKGQYLKGPGLPFVVPSTLNLNEPLGGGKPMNRLPFLFPQDIHASQLDKTSSSFKSLTSFLVKAHFATLNQTATINSAQDDEVSRKTLYHSFPSTMTKE